jgi:type I restriction enzyme S subunit
MVPQISEQEQIANFLDHETAKIDTLIDKQQQLIKLLKEKRQAVISHAVTKGLNPAAPMKDSGVEWLGEVPEGWEVSRVKNHCVIKGRIGFRGYTTEDLVADGEGALVIGATEMSGNGEIILNSPQNITWEKYYESPEIMLEEKQILVVQRGSTVGKVAYISRNLGCATINPSLVLLKGIKLNPEFLLFALMASSIQESIRSQTSSTAIPMISQEQIGNYFLTVPDTKEQVMIVEYLKKMIRSLENQFELAQRMVELLKERRTALISAAVTGKIDVRNWQPKPTPLNPPLSGGKP